jgi:hypothetical protein
MRYKRGATPDLSDVEATVIRDRPAGDEGQGHLPLDDRSRAR